MCLLCLCQSAFYDAQNYKNAVDKLKIQHKEAITQMQQLHSNAIATTNAKLKAADKLVAGFEDMIHEMTKEVGDAVKSSCKYKHQLLNAKSKASRAHYNYMQYKLLSDSLNNEVCDSDKLMAKLHMEASEYEEVIDYLYDEQSQMQQDFDQIVHYIDQWYKEDAPPPRHIAKHYVPNKDGKGMALSLYLTYLL
jgi:chromosome segregation ATPase